MKKKIALIIISVDKCLPAGGFSGGGHKVTRNLITTLINSDLFEVDIFCQESSSQNIEGINSITVIKNKHSFQKELFDIIKTKNYDYILSSDILLPYANNLIHSNSAIYKTFNGKSKLEQLFLKFYNSKKINKQKDILSNCEKAIFTVSERLKDDYVKNYNLDTQKVFVCYPAVDTCTDEESFIKHEDFTIGSIVGGGINKGGYLLAFAIKMLPKNSKVKARVIFPKIKKSFCFKTFIKILGLKDKFEILPKQEDMESYYKSIDCYALPSLNEAFGLVVTEAASNYKPSIVSSTTGASELIKDGENGFVFDRIKNPIKNLTQKLKTVSELYFNDYQRYKEIATNAKKMSEQLDWKKFTDTIIENMIGENESDKKLVI